MPVSPEIVAWLVGAMTAWAPPAPNEAYRYEAIARDILTVALDPDETSLFEDAPASTEHERRARTALVLASFAAAESGGFLVAVDSGKLHPNGAVCMMQVKVGPHGTSEGWSAKELLENRSLCVRAGLHVLRASTEKCHALRGADRFGMYTHGRCVAGNTVAGWRVGRASAWLKKHAPPESP